MVDAFFEIYKKNAFRSAIEEPALRYFVRFGKDKDRMFSRFRSLQVYLYVINKKNCFGPEIQTRTMTNKELMRQDRIDILAQMPHWGCGLFKEETKYWLENELITHVKDLEKTRILESDNQEKYKNFNEVADSASDPRHLYANPFSFFFRKNVLIKRMFEFLKEHHLFRKYCNDLYPLFREEHGFHENTIFDFLYENGFKDLNIDKAARFFWFCGVIHERDAQITWNAAPKSCMQSNHVHIHERDAQITWNTAPKSCTQSKHMQECRKHLEMCNSLKEKIIDHDQESAALYIKHRISVLRQKRIQISKCAKAG